MNQTTSLAFVAINVSAKRQSAPQRRPMKDFVSSQGLAGLKALTRASLGFAKPLGMLR
jgi:hypothetical protein